MLHLREFRERSSLSQEEAASKLGLDRTSLSRIENDKQKIDPVLLFRMAKLYNASPEDLLGIQKKEEFSLSFRAKGNLDVESREILEKIERIVKNIVFLEGELNGEDAQRNRSRCIESA
jgi:transcriptional regulator with XRE-family HTH domain